MTAATPHRRSAAPSARLAAILAGMVAGCAAPTPPSVVVPDALRVPPGEVLLRTLDARGVQIYECHARAAGAAGTEWVFTAPEASLFDARGNAAGKHFAGPTWEAPDGSQVVGKMTAKVDSPAPGAIPWLLLATRSTGRAGAFAKVSSVQRVATVGGAAPAGSCEAGSTARVPYTAQYVLYAKTF